MAEQRFGGLLEKGELELLKTVRDGKHPCYLLYDRVIRRRVFCKFGESEQIENEAAMLEKFSGVGVPALYGCLRREDGSFLFVQYIDGTTLKEYIEERGVMTEQEAVAVGIKLCRIISRLHSSDPPVIHRDIKTENVMLTRQGEVVLLDFGISRIYDDSRERDTHVLGTPLTAPPEQFGYTQTDERSDVYAIGVLLNELTTGSAKLTDKIAGGRIGKIIRKCTEFEPKNRYKNAGELLEALEAPKKSVRGMKRAAAAICAALACGIFFFAGRNISGKPSSESLRSVHGSPILNEDGGYIFKDAAVEAEVRKILNKPISPITLKDLETVTEFNVAAENGRNLDWNCMIFHGMQATYNGEEITGVGSVRSIEDFRFMPNLDTVVLINQRVSDLSPLKGLNIRNLNIFGNDVSDLSPLSECLSLQKLIVNSNPISDLSPLFGLGRLCELNIGATDITTLDGISGLRSLTRLEAHDCLKLEDMSDLKNIHQLTFLSLRPANADVIEAVRDMPNMRALYLWNADSLKDLKPFSGLENLYYLGLDTCGLESLDGLEDLSNLEYITFRFTHITDISPLENADTLNTVAMNGCIIKDYSPLFNMKNLRDLSVNSDQAERLKGLLPEDSEINLSVE